MLEKFFQWKFMTQKLANGLNISPFKDLGMVVGFWKTLSLFSEGSSSTLRTFQPTLLPE
jgi:hypothetical protein